ncbi:small-subunit processome [Sphaerosporella brunnea]|uniref:U3 small nucleolar RNA-associated protein 11 n=1 Tax=Sphaerosporella brunnea TaxID=1250544 RepID=A0A5J5F8A3_9PEZI|nr:small-subunit processome [Sphaerosporella brunnea]
MSALRNAVQRRNHKERAQPYERQKWGLLEKRKDYRLRAADHKAKKAKLSILRSLAKDRNPDEFAFGMVSSRTRDGGVRVAERKNTELDQDQVKLLKTQDAGYLRVQSDMERRKIEELEKGLAFVGASQGKHTVFVNEVEEARKFDAAEHFGTHPELVGRRFNRPRLEQLAEGEVGEEKKVQSGDDEKLRKRQEQAERKKMQKARLRRYEELEARLKRQEDLKKLEREKELQRARMGKGGSAKLGKFNMARKR